LLVRQVIQDDISKD